jgi:hypothetical protein
MNFIKLFSGSYRTSLAGVAAIFAALAGAAKAHYSGMPIDYASTAAAVMAGIGLLKARDNKVSSEEAGAK